MKSISLEEAIAELKKGPDWRRGRLKTHLGNYTTRKGQLIDLDKVVFIYNNRHCGPSVGDGIQSISVSQEDYDEILKLVKSCK